MSQRFYPYTSAPHEARLCEHIHCTNRAFWWDALYDAIWCDFHATEEAVEPRWTVCSVCLQRYPFMYVLNGVCLDCRSVMPLLWVDEVV